MVLRSDAVEGRGQNPALPGFHPDPCIIRKGSDYYLATSTFEWWPGVRLHHSRDLINWKLVGHALTRASQLDLRGTPPSGGVWAPALSWADERFWLIYSDVKAFNGSSKDLRNYVVTAPAIEGPWSEPVVLNASGFDPSLFHDDDGRKWLLNQVWDPRPDHHQFAGVTLQEYCPKRERLIGEPQLIFRGSLLRVTEGPHLYKRQGWYYLITAEGGTGEEHAVTVARSRSLTGPYQLSPQHPMLTSAGHPDHPLQKAGHGSLVDTPDGRWYLAHLCARPLGRHRRCILGRETALQAVDWPAGGWPSVRNGPLPQLDFPAATARAAPQPYRASFHDPFVGTQLNPEWNTLREPANPKDISLTERPGFLRMRGRHSLMSCFQQSLVGIRVLHFRARLRATLDFSPKSFQQAAGLALYYNTTQFHYLMLTARDGGGRELRLLCADGGKYTTPEPGIPVPDHGPITLGAMLADEVLVFTYAGSDGLMRPVGPALDSTLLSDERVIETGAWGFTGCFAALCAQDSGDSGIPADFSNFSYESA